MVKRNSKKITQKKPKSTSSSSTNREQLEKCVSITTSNELPTTTSDCFKTSLNLEIGNPETAILLLNSPEKPILLRAAAALANHYSDVIVESRNVRNGNHASRLISFDHGIANNVLVLVRHEDVFIRRFALKLLALMSTARNVQIHLTKDATCIPYFIEQLAEEKDDMFVQDFASRILAELSSDPYGSAVVLNNCRKDSGIVGLLIGKLGSEDPDVRRNCLEILDHLLEDPIEGLDVVFGSKDFSFETFYHMFDEPYPVIQKMALNVVELLVSHSVNEKVQTSFRSSAGPQRLIDILHNNEWTDLFEKVIRVLNLACENSKTAELVNTTNGTKKLFALMENAEDDRIAFELLRVMINLADSMTGKKLLHKLGFVARLFVYMEKKLEFDVRAAICQGFTRMTDYPLADDEIADGNPMDYIIQLLNDDHADWPERQSAARALKELFSSDFRHCVNFLERGNRIEHLTRIIVGQQPSTEVVANTMPWEIRATIVQAVSALASYPQLVNDLAKPDLLIALGSLLDPESTELNDELIIAGCHALSFLSVNFEARDILILQTKLHCRLHCLLVRLIKKPIIPVIQALIDLLLALCTDEHFAKLCTQEGCLFLMLENRGLAKHIGTWNACIETLFDADLPMKFAYLGRLTLDDVTSNGFHVLRYSFCPFPVLEELFRLKLCPLQPIYVANFSTEPYYNDDKGDVDYDKLEKKCAAFNAARETIRRESFERGYRVSEGTINAWLELKFGRLQPDPDLVRYLELFMAEVAAIERSKISELCNQCPSGLVRTSRIALRARLLGVFVSRQLAGSRDPSKHTSSYCLDEELEIHLHAIRERLETNVIPLGLLRVGSYLERAVLFKVMADKIGLPSSLVRGCNGKSWVEIDVPHPQIDDDTITNKEFCDITKDESNDGCKLMHYSRLPIDELLPTRYLRENFIVDLMDEPGKLIPIGSSSAERYRENKRPVCKFQCCENREAMRSARV